MIQTCLLRREYQLEEIVENRIGDKYSIQEVLNGLNQRFPQGFTSVEGTGYLGRNFHLSSRGGQFWRGLVKSKLLDRIPTNERRGRGVRYNYRVKDPAVPDLQDSEAIFPRDEDFPRGEDKKRLYHSFLLFENKGNDLDRLIASDVEFLERMIRLRNVSLGLYHKLGGKYLDLLLHPE